MPKDIDHRQKYRVLNGFAKLTLRTHSIAEEPYEVEGKKGGVVTSKVRWQKATPY
jgi:hypothetical protein